MLTSCLNPSLAACSHSTLLPWASLLFHEPTKAALTSGPLNLLFLPPGNVFSQVLTWPAPNPVLSFISLCKCRFGDQASLPDSNSAPPPATPLNSHLSFLLHFFFLSGMSPSSIHYITPPYSTQHEDKDFCFASCFVYCLAHNLEHTWGSTNSC